MKRLSFLLLAVLTAGGCIRHENDAQKQAKYSEKSKTGSLPEVQVTKAKGFELNRRKDKIELKIKDPRNNKVIEKWNLVPRGKQKGKKQENDIVIPIKNLACLSTTHYPYLKALGKENLVKGIVNSDYSKDSSLIRHVKNGTIKDLTAAGDMDTEKALNLSPDLVMVYPFSDKEYKLLKKGGVPVMNVTEYLELSPLAKAEWIKLFGLLSGEVKKAKNIFQSITKKYNNVKQQSKNKRKATSCTFFNLPFKRMWHMPSGNSFGAHLLADAGYNYLFQDKKAKGNLTFEVEQVLDRAENCSFWIIIAHRPGKMTKQKIKKEIFGVEALAAFTQGKIIFCNTAHVDYFGKAILEPHILLKDLSYWRDTTVFPKYEPHYFKKL